LIWGFYWTIKNIADYKANKDEELLLERQYHGPWVMDRRKRKGDYKKREKRGFTRKMLEIRG